MYIGCELSHSYCCIDINGAVNEADHEYCLFIYTVKLTPKNVTTLLTKINIKLQDFSVYFYVCDLAF
jgi:hypothetical protein